ncbi:trypsin-like peptidase domain-containing protein [Singulisphaera acidiphila]|uniref:Trypsin-like serine protease with C-terminal PDZ domain n=1 Tax=Singulisphaera acidiphila (strain ATCC BAA-1392 / DSM 18658 / VKM B-2454 / MOB10) TaxID=886293 RepID=L0DKD7_SINAD|nr:trypsin-like peptidase domain-containing protein [Singulisphaera acidiphila]AGA29300.1 trypsin-like serine protease with C-terminal PDZ domain [Singulisphaera acidiphila DSM 18658]
MHNLGSLVCLLLALADPPPSDPPAGSPLEVVAALESALADAIAKAEPSVVAIARDKGEDDTTTAVKGRTKNGEGAAGLLEGADQALLLRGRIDVMPNDVFGPDQISFDFGSGVVIGDRGEILTAFHVVRGAKRLHVRAMGKQSFDAEIIAADPRSDLAVIVPKTGTGITPPRLTPLPLGDATKLRKGSFLLALGNPFNAAGQDGRPSATWGILSNVARRLEVTQEEPRSLKNYPTLLQLDAKLNLGMSGGAVINLKGELVGLTTNSANAAGFDAQAGYAIPMDARGRRAVETLKQGKEVEYGFLGVALDTEHLTNLVVSAQAGTPAAEGEVHANDAILSVGDIPIQDVDSLFLAINHFTPGSSVILKLLRGDATLERTVLLAKAPVDGEVIATNRPAPWRGIRVDYTSTMPQTNFGVGVLDAMARGGVMIAEVDPNSPGEKAGLKKGQVIKSVGGRNIRSPREFMKAVANLSGPVKLDTDHGPFSVN